MSNEKPMTEQESLQLITEMIQKAKASHFHENGTSAILWGSVIGFCGLFSFFRAQFNWNTGWFDVWYLALVALIPQIIINIKESKKRVVKTDRQKAIDAIWTVYGFSIFALIFYFNTVGKAAQNLLAQEHLQLLIKNIDTNETKLWQPYIFSQSSFFLLLYALPTMVTGLATNFKPMIVGAVICYGLFITSCFTASKYDLLMNGIAGICNWLIPGLILRSRYLKLQGC
jgi:hypothetical protein